MGCPSSVILENNLVFSVCTHDPDTGILTDADAVPAYRIYENETAFPILTGNMAKLDDVNTTGFYTELIACTTANGFESGKTYTIYIVATVDSDTGGITYAFNVETQNSGSGVIEWTYTLTDDDTGFPIAGATVWVTSDVAGTIVVASSTTDINGIATFFLNAGNCYIWRRKNGYTFTNPDTEVVS